MNVETPGDEVEGRRATITSTRPARRRAPCAGD